MKKVYSFRLELPLGVVVLQADLKLDGLEEVSLLGLIGVLKELSDLGSDISCIAVSSLL